MATNIWTLEYSSVEKSLADWGFADDPSEGTFANMRVDLISFSIPGATIQSDPIFPFEAQVIIRRGRTGSGTSYSAGAIEFQGKRTLHILEGRPDYEGIHYQFAGPWYDLDQTPYLQDVKTYTGDIHALGDVFFSEVVLFQALSGGSIIQITNGAQITAILNSLLAQYSAQSLAAPFQVGTIDPAVNLPSYQAKDIKCSEAIHICMRASPDCKMWFDYSFSPPKANVRQQANCAAVSIAIGDGTSHESLHLTPRYDLQARGVTVYFKQSNSIDGINWITTVPQQAGAAAGGLRSVVQTVDMQGASVSTVSGSLKTVAAGNNMTFWQKFCPKLLSPRIRKLSTFVAPNTDTTQGVDFLDDITITDPDGNPLYDANGFLVTFTNYPNALVDGSSIAPWMLLSTGGGPVPVLGVQAVLRVHVAYCQFDADSDGNLLHNIPREEIQLHVTLTNGTTGPYDAVTSLTGAEPIPTGVATSIYNSLAILQYQGSVSIVEDECSGSVGMANTLNLTGGRTEWATMAALIQECHRFYGLGRTEVTLGPAEHLNAADLTGIFLVNRFRQIWRNPASQASAQSSIGNTVQLPLTTTKENSSTSLSQPSLHTVISDLSEGATSVIQHDATGATAHGGTAGDPIIVLEQRNSDGTQNTDGGVIELDTHKCFSVVGGVTTYYKMYVQEVPFCVDNGDGTFSTKYRLGLFTDIYTH
jgi:hypothetical protein